MNKGITFEINIDKKGCSKDIHFEVAEMKSIRAKQLQKEYQLMNILTTSLPLIYETANEMLADDIKRIDGENASHRACVYYGHSMNEINNKLKSLGGDVYDLFEEAIAENKILLNEKYKIFIDCFNKYDKNIYTKTKTCIMQLCNIGLLNRNKISFNEIIDINVEKFYAEKYEKMFK